jgi:hypothetical protein
MSANTARTVQPILTRASGELLLSRGFLKNKAIAGLSILLYWKGRIAGRFRKF